MPTQYIMYADHMLLVMSITNLAKNALVKIIEKYVLAEISKIAVTRYHIRHFCCYRLCNVHVEYMLYRALVIVVCMCIHVHTCNKSMKYVSLSYPAHAYAARGKAIGLSVCRVVGIKISRYRDLSGL